MAFPVLSIVDTHRIHSVSAEYNLSNPADKRQEPKVSAAFRDLHPADTIVDPKNWTGKVVNFMLPKPLSMELENDKKTGFWNGLDKSLDEL